MHNEAFNLMHYANEDRSVIKVVWNSRDGVTPFILYEELSHIDWAKDIKCPLLIPENGMLVFVNATEELIRPKLLKYIDNFWEEHEKGTYGKPYKSKEDAFNKLKDAWLHDGKAPWLVIADNWPGFKNTEQ